MTESTWDLVIFDHDGVLVDSEIIAMSVIADLLTRHGVVTTVDEALDTYLGTSLDSVMDAIDERGNLSQPLDRVAFSEEFHDRLFAGFRADLTALPGMPEALRALAAAGVPFVIASSGSFERVNLGITCAGIDEHFPAANITARDHVERGKPFPDLFLLAAERAGMDPGRCLVIEDSPHGVEAAHRARMKCLAIAYRTPADRLHAAEWVVEGADAMLEVILAGSARTI